MTTPDSPVNATSPPLPKLPRQLKDLEQTVYSNLRPFDGPTYVDGMRRERVSWDGVIRPLESEEELSVLALDKENLGMVGSSAASRYIAGSQYDSPLSQAVADHLLYFQRRSGTSVRSILILN